jgi:hypothetical protein
MRHTTTVLLAAACLALAGCTSSDGDDTDSKPTVAKASPTATPSSSPSASPSPTRLDLAVGDTADISGEADVTAAALAYKDTGIKGVPEMLSAGQKWAVLEVKVCNTGTEPIETSTFPWSLAYADGARIESSGMTAGELPQPLYPVNAKVSVDDCVRGNIAFQVPESGRPERVLYSPEVLDEPVEWRVE